MSNPSQVYQNLDERTLLEALQLCLSGEGLDSSLWQDYHEGFWSLTVGGFEVCMVEKEYSVFVEDGEEVFLSPSAMEVALFVSR